MGMVTFVLPGYEERPVGGYRVVYTYASHLAKQGHTIMICQAFVPAGARFKIQPDVPLWRSIDRLRRYVRGRYCLSRVSPRPTWFDLDLRVEVRNSLRLSERHIPRSDVIVATAAQTAPVVAAAAERQGCRGIYFLQGLETWNAPPHFVDSTWRLPLTRIVIAPWLADRGRELGVSTILVPNSIDASEFPPGPAIASRSVSLLALVSDHAGKRTDLVVSVMRFLDSHIAGFRGITFGICARPDGLPGSVAHVRDPPREVLAGLYADAKIYLCASDAEGWHLPPAEAMAAGAAIVSTDIGGVRAYADSTAVFAPIGDARALGNAARDLLNDAKRCQVLATRGQRVILSRTPDQAAEEFMHAIFSAASVGNGMSVGSGVGV